MARERYLLDDEEDTIHNPEAEKKIEKQSETKKSKWVNFWYYHKWHVIIGVVVCLIIAGFAKDMLSKVEPDYQIALMTQDTYPSDVLESLQNQIAKYGKDLNGDGKVVIQINNYVVKHGDDAKKADYNQQMAGVVKYTSDLQNIDSVIFITDDKSFLNEPSIFSYLDGTKPKENAKDYEKMKIAWEKCKILPKLNPQSANYSSSDIQKLMSKLSVSLRIYDQKGNQKDTYYSESVKLFNKLVYDK